MELKKNWRPKNCKNKNSIDFFGSKYTRYEMTDLGFFNSGHEMLLKWLKHLLFIIFLRGGGVQMWIIGGVILW